MKLLIHIGTQKTATTSIQRFCVHNRALLISRGYLYPKNNTHPFLFNFLAQQLAMGERGRVAEYLQQARREAEREKCHTVVISAESFYAMSFFYLYPREKSRALEYWQIEARLIEELSRCCSGYDEVKIACYLRPQDDFAAALYNQLIKNAAFFCDTYDEFIETARPMFDYERHILLWEQHFGADSVSIRNFLACDKDIVEDFFQAFLQPDIYREADREESRSNLRLNRDVLEFKRKFNRADPDIPLAYLGIRLFNQINPEFGDQPGYQIFAPLEFRKHYFGPFAAGNDSLARRYILGEMPVLVLEQDPTYPGLSDDKAAAIDRRLQSLLDRPKTRLKLALRRFEHWFIDRVPGGRWLLSPLRILRIRWRSRFSKN